MRMTMRLFKRAGWYHLELYRGKSRALKTRDPKEAQALHKEIEREYLHGRLINLDSFQRISLADFRTAYLADRDGISEWTIKKDALSLKLLADVIGGNIQLRAITDQSVKEFKRACRARGATTTTINGYLRHIRAAFSWAVGEQYLKSRPKIDFYKKAEEKPRVLAPGEIKRILRAAFKRNHNLGLRFFIHLYTGARRRELCELTWQNMDFEADTITLTGKGKTRTIPMVKAIKLILKDRRDIGLVFDDLHRDTVSHRFHDVVESCGIVARLHDLRHTCATYLLSNGVPLEVVQEILGHEAIATTQIYAKVLQPTMKKEMAKLKYI